MQKDNSNQPNEVTEQLSEFSQKVEDAVKTLFETTRSVTSQALKATSDKFEGSEDAVSAGVQSSVNLIKKYPLESAVACLGVGFLIGKLLSNKD